jgi:diacylglycerol kinase family enzyme
VQRLVRRILIGLDFVVWLAVVNVTECYATAAAAAVEVVVVGGGDGGSSSSSNSTLF